MYVFLYHTFQSLILYRPFKTGVLYDLLPRAGGRGNLQQKFESILAACNNKEFASYVPTRFFEMTFLNHFNRLRKAPSKRRA